VVSAERYRRITAVTLAAVGLIIVTGAAVRLTGSGLGCTEWPTCEQGQLVAPLEAHAWIEFGNRLVTGLIAIPVGLAFLGSFRLRPRRRELTWWSLGLVAGVGAQAVLGGITVRVELAPGFVSAHFLLSMVLLWNAVVLHRRATSPPGDPVPVVDPRALLLGRAVAALAIAVLVTGTLVTGTGPHAGDERAQRYDFAITEVARIHSLLVWAFLLATLGALWHLARTGAPAAVNAEGRRLVIATLLQGGVGYAQYAAGVPAWMVIAHIVGSVLVTVTAVRFQLSMVTRTDHPGTARPEPGEATITGPRNAGERAIPA
jgi:cytochrome c oxidase assembly protein subunit 15